MLGNSHHHRRRQNGCGLSFAPHGNGDLIKPAHLVMSFWRSRVAVWSAMDTPTGWEHAPPPSGVLLGGLSMCPRAGAASFGLSLASPRGGLDRPATQPANPRIHQRNRQAAKACRSTVESALAGPRGGACQRSIVVRMAAGADSVF
jgi:hypothetical protein